jgi:hypothetical protein
MVSAQRLKLASAFVLGFRGHHTELRGEIGVAGEIGVSSGEIGVGSGDTIPNSGGKSVSVLFSPAGKSVSRNRCQFGFRRGKRTDTSSSLPEPVVSDLVKPSRQDVLEEASQEFPARQPLCTPRPGGTVFPAEAHMGLVHVENPCVADRRAKDIFRQIGQHGGVTMAVTLAEGDPFSSPDVSGESHQNRSASGPPQSPRSDQPLPNLAAKPLRPIESLSQTALITELRSCCQSLIGRTCGKCNFLALVGRI